jgi:hypothetical protein
MGGEWTYAKRDYLRAFALLRGDPFQKMYDNWSEALRGELVGKMETALHTFVEGCKEHNDPAAKKILERIRSILPYSAALAKMS